MSLWPESYIKGCSTSPDELFRYRLWRIWDIDRSPMLWIMLNPSTADHEVDDPTIRRCMGFAHREGCGGIEVINLYALRATKPRHLLDHPDPEGPDNDAEWTNVLNRHEGPVVAAWGASRPKALAASEALIRHAVHILDWLCLGHTASGHPRHPLYVRADQPLEAL